MSNLFHGSIVADICTIKVTTSLHGTNDVKVAYLTDNFPYSLFYKSSVSCIPSDKIHTKFLV